MDASMDGNRTDGWKDGWVDRLIDRYFPFLTRYLQSVHGRLQNRGLLVYQVRRQTPIYTRQRSLESWQQSFILRNLTKAKILKTKSTSNTARQKHLLGVELQLPVSDQLRQVQQLHPPDLWRSLAESWHQRIPHHFASCLVVSAAATAAERPGEL